MVQRDGLVAATPHPTASWGMRLATMRPAHGGLIDRRTRPNYGPGRVISRVRTAVHFLSILSFRSSTASPALSFTSSNAPCVLSMAESSLPLSLPLSSWRSPSRLVSSSPVTAPTACFARPSILSVFSPMADLLGTSGLVAKTRRPSDDEPDQKELDRHRECRRTVRYAAQIPNRSRPRRGCPSSRPAYAPCRGSQP